MRGQGALHQGQLGGGARGRAHPHRHVRRARPRDRAEAPRHVPRRVRKRGFLPRGEARLHRPPLRAQTARVRRDLLQLGGDAAAPPHLPPERLHLLEARDLDRAHRGRRAHLPLLLPPQRRARGHPPQDAGRHGPRRPRRPLRGPRARHGLSHARDRRALPARVGQRQGLPAPGAALALLPRALGVPRGALESSGAPWCRS